MSTDDFDDSEFNMEPSKAELDAIQRLTAAMSRIEQEVGMSMKDQVAALPTMFGHWEPDIATLLDLWRHHHTDLAVEHVLLSPDIAEVFDYSTRRKARNRIEALSRLDRMKAALELGSHVQTDYTLPKGTIAVCGNRLIWVDMEYDYSLGVASCSGTSEIEIEMAFSDSPYLQYSRLQHQHVLFCEDCQATAPLTSCLFDEVSKSLFASIRAQLGALQQCLSVSGKRVRELADMQPGAGQHNIDQFTSEALRLLAWRAIELAAFLELDVSVFLPDRSELNPWIRLMKGEGHQTAVAFVKEFDIELLEALFVNLVTPQVIESEWLWFDKVLEGPFCVPTDGDLSTYSWAIEVRETTSLDAWAKTLSQPPYGVYLPAMVKLLRSAARRELDGVVKPNVRSRPEDDVRHALDRIEGLIENGNALQMPMLELLEKLVKISSRPSAVRAEESLKNHLGPEIVDALDPDARQTLIGAEYIFMDREVPDPQTVLRGIALAFELQLTRGAATTLEREIQKLRAKVAPTHFSSRPGQPIPRKTHEENGSKMLRLERILENPDSVQKAALSRLGLEGRRVLDAIRAVRPIRNDVVHGTRPMSYERVRQQREIWFGIAPGTASIFSALLPLQSK